MHGWDWVVWLAASWIAIGGLSVAICIKYSNNIAKDFATSVAIILSTVGSIYIFDFQPGLFFMIGAILVMLGIFLYSSAAKVGNYFSNSTLKKSTVKYYLLR
jgi:UDP-sugar transporter A1/2/3